jgi:tetratricopeptide (TPR) repeat protein
LLLNSKTIYKLLVLAILLLVTTSITIPGHNDYYIAKPTLALVDVNPNQTLNRNLTINIFHEIKSHSHVSYPWKQIESGVKVSESRGTSLPFRDPLNMPTDAGFKFELVSEEQFKPHIHITVNNNNAPPAANAGKKIMSSNQTSVTVKAPVQKLSRAASPINRTAPVPTLTTIKLVDRGDALNKQGNYTQAIALFDAVLAIDPNNKGALSGKGDALSGQDKDDLAIQYYDIALDIDSRYKDALYGKGNALNDRGNYTQAMPLFDKALAIDPNYKDALYGKGDVLYYQRNYVQAIQYYDRALDIDPNYKDALNSKGNALSGQGNYVQAIQYYDRALDIDPNFKDALNGKGAALIGQGNYTQAILLFDKALAIDPNFKNALIGKGEALRGQGNYTQAIPLFDKALAIDPNNKYALNDKANATAAAQASASTPASTQSPSSGTTSLGNMICHYIPQSKSLLCRMENSTAAQARAPTPLNQSTAPTTSNLIAPGNMTSSNATTSNNATAPSMPTQLSNVTAPPTSNATTNQSTPTSSSASALALVDNGNALFKQGNYTQALQYYDKALDIDPNSQEALAGKGQLLALCESTQCGLTAASNHTTLASKDVFALVDNGNALFKQGNYTQALQYYDKALDIDPNSQEALAGKGQLLALCESTQCGLTAETAPSNSTAPSIPTQLSNVTAPPTSNVPHHHHHH